MKYTTTISKIESLSNEVKLFRLEFPQGTEFHFIPGQFVMVSAKDAAGETHKRAYSLASSPSKKYIELCIKIQPEGTATQILGAMAVGETLMIEGPYGKAVLDMTKKKELILIATGCGVGAMRSILYSLFESHYDAPVWLFFGFRYDKDFLFKNELLQLEEKYSHFHFVPVISRPSEHSDPDIDIGHIDYVLPQYITNAKNKEAFISGSLAMARDVIAALQEIGFSQEQIKTDAWD